MDVLFDYRPALRQRTGVGEYVHELAAALARQAGAGDRLHLFSSSWKDRLSLAPALRGRAVEAHDLRIPGSVLSWLWHRAEWPPAERLVGVSIAVTHAAHPLLVPASTAARVITVHDLDFLDHPERSTAEIRRDYAALARRHAERADGVLAVSDTTRRDVVDRLGVDPAKIAVAHAGVPPWIGAGRTTPREPGGEILFLGTLEPRKNVGALLEAYARLLARRTDLPPLRLAGRAGPGAEAWLDRASRPPLAGRVEVSGYVDDAERRGVFERASMLVLPSWTEGFGLPVLEAMALGVPVVVSDRGALREVAGEAAVYLDPADPDTIAAGIERVLDDDRATAQRIEAGLARVAGWSWDAAAGIVWQLYRDAVARRAERRADRD